MQQVVTSVGPANESTCQRDEDQLEYEPTHRWTDPETEQLDDRLWPQSPEGSSTHGTAGSAGRYAEDFKTIAHTFGAGCTAFERLREEQVSAGSANEPWTPFKDMEEWELAQFLTKELTQTAIDKYLKLPIVSGTSQS
jgi:hypothetical protein